MDSLGTLAYRLNEQYRRGNLTMKDLKDVGVNVKAATTPCSSFIGIFQGRKAYAYYDYPTNTWIVEKA